MIRKGYLQTRCGITEILLVTSQKQNKPSVVTLWPCVIWMVPGGGPNYLLWMVLVICLVTNLSGVTLIRRELVTELPGCYLLLSRIYCFALFVLLFCPMVLLYFWARYWTAGLLLATQQDLLLCCFALFVSVASSLFYSATFIFLSLLLLCSASVLCLPVWWYIPS